MQSLSTKHLIVRNIPAALAAMSIIFGTAVYLELLGWRILSPELSLSQAWSYSFVFGAFRTAGGAGLLGMLPLLIGIIISRTRSWSLSHPVLLWSFGTGIFLLALLALILSTS